MDCRLPGARPQLSRPGRLCDDDRQYPQCPLLDDPSHQPGHLHPVPDPEHLCHRHRIAGHDLRDVLDRLPGYDHPDLPQDEDRVHLPRPPLPDLYRCRQLDAACGGAGGHVRVQVLGEPRLGLWSCRIGIDDDLGHHDGGHLLYAERSGQDALCRGPYRHRLLLLCRDTA